MYYYGLAINSSPRARTADTECVCVCMRTTTTQQQQQQQQPRLLLFLSRVCIKSDAIKRETRALSRTPREVRRAMCVCV